MPSAHAQFAAFVAMFLILALNFRFALPGRHLLRRASTVAAALWAVLVGYSRIYLDYHTSPQVVVGFGVGKSLSSLQVSYWLSYGFDWGTRLGPRSFPASYATHWQIS